MMNTITAPAGFPLTLADRALAPDVLRAKATYSDYLKFAEVAPYNVEYYNGEIISMSQASLPHDALVIRIGYILTLLFEEADDLEIFGSNIKIEVLVTGQSFNADISIVRGEPNYLRLPSGMFSTVSITNPELVVEVLSPSTMLFDLGDKLESYKQIPSLQQILLISPEKLWVISYSRSDMPGVWLNSSFHALTDSVTVLGRDVKLADIYKKMKFS